MSNSPRKKKSLGQHFLRDKHTIHKIVQSVPAGKEDRVVEIGPGDGALTSQLFETCRHLTAIEIDPVMVNHLNENLPELHVIKKDILKVNWDEIADTDDRPIHVIGNLPYYITSQILFSLLASRTRLASATLMMQKEVADRIVAEPGNKTYGILSVQTQLMSTPAVLFDVHPGAFSPPPNVMSSVIQLHFDRPTLACSDEHLKTVVRMAFNQRRKKLSNALKRLNTELPESEFDFSLRAEALQPATYEKLTARLEQLGTFE
jgi:16S rRNA (adenine1518-N6/adenine1519-N6)-dimethyltransferase